MTAAQAVPLRTPLAPANAGGSHGNESRALGQNEHNGGFDTVLSNAARPASETSQVQQPKNLFEAGERRDTGRQGLGERGRAETDGAASDADIGDASQHAQAAGSQPFVLLPSAFALALSTFSPTEVELPVAPAAPQADGATTNLGLEGDRQLAMPSDSETGLDALAMPGLSEDDLMDVKAQLEETNVKVARQETHFAVSKPSPAAQAMAVERVGTLEAIDEVQAEPGQVTEVRDGRQEKAGANTSARADAAVAEKPVPERWSASTGQGQRQAESGSGQSNAPASQSSLAAQSVAGSPQGVQAGAQFEEVSDGLSPGRQIASRVTSELADASRRMDGTTSRDGVLKVLTIELKPANLGSVTVRLSLKDDVISLRMEASRHETVAAIEKERNQLASALKSAGYVVDEITTHDAPRVATRGDGIQSDPSLSSSFSQNEGHGRSRPQQEFSSSGRGQGEQPAPDRNSRSGSITTNTDEMARGRSDAIYV